MSPIDAPLQVIFGKRIKLLRQQREMTQKQLAEVADISISFISGIERGKKSPTLDTLQKLANALQLTLSEMLSFDANVKVVEYQKTMRIRRLFCEYAEKIDKIYNEK